MMKLERRPFAILLLLTVILLLASLLLLGCAPGELTDDMYFENVYPNSDNTGQIGDLGNIWNEGHFDEIWISSNTSIHVLDGSPLGGGGGGAEVDPVFTASDAFVITAADIAGWDGHPALTTGTHGVGAGDIVGTTLIQELDSKTLDSSVGKGTWTASGTWKLPAMFFNGDITTDRWLSTGSNTFFGVDVVGADNLTHTAGSEGYYNTAIGYFALHDITTSYFNTAVGAHALENLTTGIYNTAVGQLALGDVSTGQFNTAVGMQALVLNTGSYNTALGLFAGANNIAGDSNVFLGSQAGKSELGSNKLYIDVVDTATPLIYGDFSTNEITVNGQLGIGVSPPTAYIHLPAGTVAAGTAPLKMTTGTLLTTPEAGVLEYDGTGIYLTNTNHRRFISQAADSIITATSVSNNTTETTVYTAVLNANELKAHRVYRLNLYGEISTASAVDTITMVVHINGTTLINLTSNAGVVTDDPCHAEVVFTIRAIGDAGEISSHCDMDIGSASIHINESSLAVDTTVINNITVTFQWSAAKVDNIATLDQAFLEVLD